MDQQPNQTPETEVRTGLTENAVVEITEDHATTQLSAQNGDELQWRASEYIQHEKSANWFIVLGVLTLALMAVAIFILREFTFALLIAVMAVAVVVWARRPASEVQYFLDHNGIAINDKFFDFHNFRAFGVVQEAAMDAVTLLPTKRFSPGVTVYFPPELGERIVDIFGEHLPMEDVEPDFIDRLSRRINF